MNQDREPLSNASNKSPAAAASPNVEGNDSRMILSTPDEVRTQLIAVTRLAERSLCIYTKTLESELYEQPAFLDALKRLVLARSFARVRILLAELSPTLNRHPVVSLAARLPSLIDIRVMRAKHYDASAFVVVDERAVVYRMHCTRWDGMADHKDVAVARLYMGQFERAWAESLPLEHDAVGAHVGQLA